MAIHPAVPHIHLLSGGLVTRGRVCGIDPDGYVLVSFEHMAGSHQCEVLRQSEHQTPPDVGATVLVLGADDPSHGMPVVLGAVGRLGTATEPPSRPIAPADKTDVVPDELLIEAKQSLTLKVGDGSITIRADGKILIKGRDLVSHAQRTNRIKGGSVAIN